MKEMRLYCAGTTQASRCAAGILEKAGVTVVPEPDPKVGWLLLDVPTKLPAEELETLLGKLPPGVTVAGGNLGALPGYRTVDLLKDPLYQAENAYITAECALSLAMGQLGRTIRGCPVLIIGWGRIGRCLAKLLGALGAEVTVAARREGHRALCQALGYQSGSADDLAGELKDFRLILNTVPAPVFSREALSGAAAVKLELASQPGLLGEDVIIARGLPGKYMPESSGELIARTCLRLMKEVLP